MALAAAAVLCGCELLFNVEPPSPTQPCTSATACATGQVCAEGNCRNPCTSAADCDPGQSCVALPDVGASVCVPSSCTSDNECPDGATCLGGQCRAKSDASTAGVDATLEAESGAYADRTVSTEASGDADGSALGDTTPSDTTPGADGETGGGDAPGEGGDADAEVDAPDGNPGDADAGDGDAGDADAGDGEGGGSDADAGDAHVCSPATHLLLFGGNTGSRVLQDTWEWGDAGWVEVDDGGTPPPNLDAGPRARAGQAMGTVCGAAYLFGGTPSVTAASALDDQWRWSGTSWSPVDPAMLPPPTSNMNSAVIGDTWMFYGGVAGSVSTDTYLFAGANWAPPIAAPVDLQPRKWAAMAPFDGGALLTGGTDPFLGSFFPDTWFFDGAVWAPVNASPIMRNGASAAALGNTVVLFGGMDQSGIDTDTTTVWDGTDWHDLTLSVSPPARSYASMGTLGDTVVLYGGSTVGMPDSDTWLWDGTRWTPQGDAGPPARYWAPMTGSQ